MTEVMLTQESYRKRIAELEQGLAVCVGALKVAATSPHAIEQSGAAAILQCAEACLWPEEVNHDAQT